MPILQHHQPTDKVQITLPSSWMAKLKGGLSPVTPSDIGAVVPKSVPVAFHHVAVTGTTEFHDYESLGSDEHGTFGFQQETLLSTNGLAVTLLTWSQGFGGEERVEIDIVGALASDGVLGVTINARFYEGATEGTTEIEDTKTWQAVIPRDKHQNFEIHLKNDEDDWATVRATVSNRTL